MDFHFCVPCEIGKIKKSALSLRKDDTLESRNT